ncbi:MAG: TetR/AcrR family transcriptional regulator [Pseudomonadales bacterium]|nr:TetR/AcrR family transcriptional regulator [Pseudomonadales bacterium]
MAQKDTVERILDAAEALFAERGFAETSLRTITSTAGVNLAAVNYHFGSKKALIQAIFVRYLDPLADAVTEELNQAEADDKSLAISDLLMLLTRSVYKVHGHSARRITGFMRLLGLAYTQSQGHLRGYLGERYGSVFKRFVGLLRPACPELSDIDLFWNTHFALGAAVFTLSNQQALAAMLESDTGVNTDINQVVNRLIPFMTSGIKSHQDPASAQGAAQGYFNLPNESH